MVDARETTIQADLIITNPPFSLALPIIDSMLVNSLRVVAVYHRMTLREPAKTLGLGRTLFRGDQPNLTLWCPRFAHMRSKTTGKWATDAVACVWSVWCVYGGEVFGDVWPDDNLFDELKAYTPGYRARVDALIGGKA